MGAVPEELVAAPAHEEYSQPAVGPGRNALAQVFLGPVAQLAAAAHAARPAEREAKLAEHQRYLLRNLQCRRQPEGRNDPVAQEAPLHQHAVRGEDCSVKLPPTLKIPEQ